MESKNLLEHEGLGLKRQLPEPKKLAIEIVALANARGGQIVVGYDEKTGQVYPQNPDQRVEEHIANVISDHCAPRVDYFVSYDTLKKKPVLVINVSVGSARPYYVKSGGLTQGVYIRVGSTSRRADQETLARLIREGKNISYDSEPVSRRAKLDPALVKEFLKRRNERLGAAIPRVSSVLLDDLGLTKKNTPTIAGALLFGESPQEISELSNAIVRCARFKGLEKGIFIDQADFGGPLPEQVEEAQKFILRNIKLSGDIKGARRKDVFEYDPRVVREIITNAIVHRDYSITGSSILVAIYDDRIELTSPGGLPGQVTADTIVDRQYSRNPIIAKRMFEMSYFDAWGPGIDMIMIWAMKTERPAPQFVDEASQFTIVVYGSDREARMSEDAASPMKEIEKRILSLAQRKGTVSNLDCREKMGLSKMQAQVALGNLFKTGKLQREGRGRLTHYVPKG